MLFRDVDKDFERNVKEAFAFISSSAAPKVVHSYYHEQAFGNALVELEGDNVRVRVTRDRGQIAVDLAPRGCKDWFIEYVVLQSVGVDSNVLLDLSDRTVEQAAKPIKANFEAITHAFGRENWKATEADLEARLERRGKELEVLLFSPRGTKQ